MLPLCSISVNIHCYKFIITYSCAKRIWYEIFYKVACSIPAPQDGIMLWKVWSCLDSSLWKALLQSPVCAFLNLLCVCICVCVHVSACECACVYLFDLSLHICTGYIICYFVFVLAWHQADSSNGCVQYSRRSY